jgi:CRISPR/Cas system-associated protein endoribonuclease Cas2
MPVRFRGKDGRFVPAEERFTQAVSVEAYRRGRWVYLIEEKKAGKINPKDLAIVLNRKEFENIAPAFDPIKTVKPRSKYQAWNIAEQIDKTRGVRRKLLRVKLTIQVGTKKKQVQFYQKINKNQKSSARIYHRINEVLGAEGYYTYKSVNGRLVTERKGKKVKILKAEVEQVI